MTEHEHRPAGGGGVGGVVDHLFRTGGGFRNWGGPQLRLFCGFHLDTAQTELCGREQDDHLSPEAFAERERLRNAAPALLAALERAVEALDSFGWGLESDCARIQGQAAIAAARGDEAAETTTGGTGDE